MCCSLPEKPSTGSLVRIVVPIKAENKVFDVSEHRSVCTWTCRRHPCDIYSNVVCSHSQESFPPVIAAHCLGVTRLASNVAAAAVEFGELAIAPLEQRDTAGDSPLPSGSRAGGGVGACAAETAFRSLADKLRK